MITTATAAASSGRSPLSRELPAGDIVAVGEVPLAVGRIGWTLVRDGLNEVRADEHGTRPLPALAVPDESPPDPDGKKYPR